MVGPTRVASFARGCTGFALGAVAGLLAADLWALSMMESAGVSPPRTFHNFYWVYFLALVGCATFVHATGRLVFSARSGFVLASLAGLLSTLPLHLPRDATYEAMCAPICTGRHDAWPYVLAIAFLSALLDRIRRGRSEATDVGPGPSSLPIRAYVAVAIALAILALPTFIVVYHAWYHRVSVEQYAECLSLPVPTTLETLEQRFGPGRRVQVHEFGEFKGYEDYAFEPNPDYSFAWSTDISASVAPGTDKVADLFCGEGW